MVHRWWFHKGPPHDCEHHHKLPPIFVSKKGHVQESPQKERKPPKKKIMRKKISRKKLSRKETGIA
jgi:hypothetical protein